MFGVSLLILMLVIGLALGIMAGPGSPLTWLLVAALLVIPFIHRKLTAKRFFTWKDEYSVGIDSIDQQHKNLFSIVNEFHSAVKQKSNKSEIFSILNKLIQYTEAHFKDEEKIAKAKTFLLNGFFGLLIIFVAWGLAFVMASGLGGAIGTQK